MWEETSLKLEQICDGCHHVRFLHWGVQSARGISNDLFKVTLVCSCALKSKPVTGFLWHFPFAVPSLSHYTIWLFFFLPLLIPPYLNVYSFPPEAETQSGADQPIAPLTMFVWGWGVVDFGPSMHAIYHPREFRWLPDSRLLLAAWNRKWNQWLGQRDLISA